MGGELEEEAIRSATQSRAPKPFENGNDRGGEEEEAKEKEKKREERKEKESQAGHEREPRMPLPGRATHERGEEGLRVVWRAFCFLFYLPVSRPPQDKPLRDAAQESLRRCPA